MRSVRFIFVTTTVVFIYLIVKSQSDIQKDQLEEKCDSVVRSYLSAVYPAANIARATNSEVRALFESLEYYYFCSRRRCYLVEPRCEFFNVDQCPELPYLPPGAYYYADTRSARDPSEVFDKKWYALGSFFRWERPIKLLHDERSLPRSIDFSTKAQRLGPAPSWTNPLAIVKYPLFPLGFQVHRPSREEEEEEKQQRGRQQQRQLFEKKTLFSKNELRLKSTNINVINRNNRKTTHFSNQNELRAFKTNMTLSVHSRPVRPLFSGDVYGLEALVKPLELTRRGHDYLIEIEQFGGPVWIRDCGAQAVKRNAYAVCGLWANVWKGTGIFLRVDARFTFRSASKATAVVEMLLEIEARERRAASFVSRRKSGHTYRRKRYNYRNYPSLTAIARHMDIFEAWLQEMIAYPDASPATSLIATLYVGAGIEVCAQADRYQEIKLQALEKQTWLRRRPRESATTHRRESSKDYTSKNSNRIIENTLNQTAVHPRQIVDWLRRGPKHTRHILKSRDLAVDWLFSICGYGGYFRHPLTPNRPYTGWDGLLMVLSCLLGVRTLLFEASSNDNGLYHHELVDYDFPSVWPSSLDGGLNSIDQCLPPIPDHEDSEESIAELENYWRKTNKVVLHDPFNHEPWQPCDIINHTWVFSPSRCRSTKMRHIQRQGARPRAEEILHNCYLVCRGSMSEAHSLITDMHMSHPERPEFIRRRMRLFRRHRAQGWTRNTSTTSAEEDEDEGLDPPDSIPEEDYIEEDTELCSSSPH